MNIFNQFDKQFLLSVYRYRNSVLASLKIISNKIFNLRLALNRVTTGFTGDSFAYNDKMIMKINGNQSTVPCHDLQKLH